MGIILQEKCDKNGYPKNGSVWTKEQILKVSPHKMTKSMLDILAIGGDWLWPAAQTNFTRISENEFKAKHISEDMSQVPVFGGTKLK